MNKRGFTLIELLAVMAILILFGLLGYTLVQSSINAYSRMTTGQEGARKARLALDYIQSRIRQSDGSDRINVIANPVGDGDALLIKGESVDDDGLYIMASDGMLYECYAPTNQSPTLELSQSVVAVEGFTILKGDDGLTLRVTYQQGDDIGYLDRLIAIRSVGKEGKR